MHPTSVRYCPGPEHGVFYISIVDIILRSALVGFSLLRASNYYYRKGQVIVDNLTIFTIHGRLLCITLLQSISLKWEINIFISINDIVLKNGQNVPLYIKLQWYSYFCHFSDWSMFHKVFSQISNLCFLLYFMSQFFEAVKEFHNFCF